MSVVSRKTRQKSWQFAERLASVLSDLEASQRQFGDRLRALARARGITSDEEAARQIGVSYRQYQRWLAGDSEPRTSTMKRIAAAYDVELADLLGAPDGTQFDRIEDKLNQLLAIVGAGVTPEDEADEVLAELEEPTTQRRRGSHRPPT